MIAPQTHKKLIPEQNREHEKVATLLMVRENAGFFEDMYFGPHFS